MIAGITLGVHATSNTTPIVIDFGLEETLAEVCPESKTSVSSVTNDLNLSDLKDIDRKLLTCFS